MGPICFIIPKYIDMIYVFSTTKTKNHIHLLIRRDPPSAFTPFFAGSFGPFKSGRCQWRRRPFPPIETHLTLSNSWKPFAAHFSSERWKWSSLMYVKLMLLPTDPTVNGQFGSPVKQMWYGQNTVNFMGSFTISTGWTDDLIHQPLLKALELVKQSHVSNPDVWPLIFTSPSFFVGPESDAPFMADLFFSNIQKQPQVQLKQRIINPSPDDGSRVACSCPEQIDVPNPEPFSGSAVNRGKYASLCFKH